MHRIQSDPRLSFVWIMVHERAKRALRASGLFWLSFSIGHAETLLEQGYRQMYNLQFVDAHRTFARYEQEHTSDPLGPVSDAAAYLFSEFDRLKILQSQFFVEDHQFHALSKSQSDPTIKRNFENDLAKAQQLADAESKGSPDNPDALFANALRLGLHADYLALIDKQELAALRDVKAARDFAGALLARHPQYYDAYIAVGVENYLLSLKPAPVRWLLRMGGAETDKQLGIENLQLTAEKGHFLLPYARLLLAVAALRDHDTGKGRQLLSWLAANYPNNALYKRELAKLQ